MTPIRTLAEVRAWLATLRVGEVVDLRQALFDAAMVDALFSLIPDSDPIALTIAEADAAGAVLRGQAEIMGVPDTTARFGFSQGETLLLCQLDLGLPDTQSWSLLQPFNVSFDGLAATLLPDEHLGVVGVEFSATLKTNTASAIAVPVRFTVPSFDGDWQLSGSFPALGGLGSEALAALAGNSSLTSILAPGINELKNFELTSFRMAFNPAESTCSLIGLGIGYKVDWPLFGDKFNVTRINLAFEALEPFGGNAYLQAELSAKMKIGGVFFDVGGQFPDKAVFARLDPTTPLAIADAFAFFHVALPVGFPAISIAELGFTIFPDAGQFSFEVRTQSGAKLLGDVTLDEFWFAIDATVDQGSVTGTGTIATAFTIADTTLSLTGVYASGKGVRVTGSAAKVKVGILIAELAPRFGVHDVPSAIRSLTLETLALCVDTGKRQFEFTCTGTTAIADVTVSFAPTIILTCDAAGKFSGEFGGELVLEMPTPGGAPRAVGFTVTFAKDGMDSILVASWDGKGGAFGFADLAKVFDFALPPIPPSLDLTLLRIGFVYNFGTRSLAFGVTSQSYGEAAFATMPVAGKRQYVFVLDTGKEFSLSNLPLVGEQLAAVQDVSITDLQILISTLATVDRTTARRFNELIAQSTTAARLPDAGFDGTFVATAQLELGGDPRRLNLSLGGTAAEGSHGRLLAPGHSMSRAPAPGAVSADGGVKWFNVQRSFGPVSIERIGALYESTQQMLWFELDATLAFGPLSLSLVGLGIGSPLTSFSPAFDLQGLGVSYRKPPLEIAGALVSLAPPGAPYVEFEGGLLIRTSAFSIVVFGYYGNRDGFSSMFLFGALAYPIGGPPAFFVTGLALGFGYNLSLRIPTINEVAGFPFVRVLPATTAPDPDVLGPNPTPLSVLKVIRETQPPWVTRKAGSLWFAAGVTFTSFQLVRAQAIVFVEVGEGLVIALVGTAGSQFPQYIGSSGGPLYAAIELELLIRIAPIEGVVSVEAALAKRSFLLDRACVLTGGFAFYVWFGDNPHAGDFVLTLGGYHPAYTPPAHYPRVPRVGFHWSLDSHVSISGGAYFALTPAALMLGGRLDINYRAGNLRAWFSAYADIVLKWKPFWFDANIGVTIGVSYKLDLLFTTTTLSVELGCNLRFWGPPTGGSVSIDWYVISFTIPFGTSRGTPQVASGWVDVDAMLPHAGTSGATTVIALTAVGGLIPGSTAPTASARGLSREHARTGLAPARLGIDPATAPWNVRATQFAFTVSTPIPITTVSVAGTAQFRGATFDVFPLRWRNVSSSLALAITAPGGGDATGAFELTVVTSAVPTSLWGSPPTDGSGRPQVPNGAAQMVPGQLTGVAAQVQAPAIGASAGPVRVAEALARVPLPTTGAVLPITGTAQPTGDHAINGGDTLNRIADPASGIASPDGTAARNAIYASLTGLDYAPIDSNDPMTRLAEGIGAALFADPLLAPQGTGP